MSNGAVSSAMAFDSCYPSYCYSNWEKNDYVKRDNRLKVSKGKYAYQIYINI